MSLDRRYLQTQVEADIARKMVLLSGPRQVGKTTLARALPGASVGYLNYDIAAHRERFLKNQLPAGNLWIFDEIHKYRTWRNWLKGAFDGRPDGQRILVTGSARLELYRRGGDSLQGRYHSLRLHPLSVAELGITTQDDLHQLLKLGGFPEPFFSGSEREARRWSRDYRDRLVREEVTSLERVNDLGKLELLALRLPDLVGSAISINALREDLQVSHKTVEGWVEIFERLEVVYRLPPFGAPKIRAVKHARKHYQVDWSLVQNEVARFENFVAAHLRKWVEYQQDVEGRDVELRYFRDVDGREVDFVVCERGLPMQFIEAKWADDAVSPALKYLHQRFPAAQCWQLSAVGNRDDQTADGIRVTPALSYLQTLV